MSNILVVDDDDVVRKAVRTILDREGHTTLEADDGSCVPQMLHENHVDLLLTDILMPGWNGLQTIVEIRRVNRDVKIIAMSGSCASSLHMDDATKLGADAFIEKPFSGNDLRSLVTAVIKKAS